jgi:hypothetical protein
MLFPMRSIRRLPSLFMFLCVAAHPAQAASTGQFDLICRVHGHVAADPHPRYRGDYPANERAWTGWHHFMVDLQTRRFCLPLWCETDGPKTIAAVSGNQIVFLDRPRATARDNFEFMVVRRSDGYFRFRTGDNEGYVRVESGRCRRAPFSGWHPRQVRTR